MIEQIKNNINIIRLKFVNNKQLLYHFFSGQLLTQLLSFLLSYLILRWLSIEEQAKYTFVFSIQTMFALFTDFGITSSIISLVGRKFKNKEYAGKIVSAATHFRRQLIILSTVVTIIILPIILQKQRWSFYEVAPLILVSLVNVYFITQTAVNQTLFQLNKDLKALYRTTNEANFFRLITSIVIHLSYKLNALLYLLINLFTTIYQNFKVVKISKIYYSPTKHTSLEKKKIIKFIIPVIPSTLFFIFQGQISIFLITYFGNIRDIATIGALSRLGQFFAIFSSFYAMIINPYISKLKKEDVKKKYLEIVFIFFGLFSLLCVIALFFPNLALLYLGDNFKMLNNEISIYLISTSLLYLNYLLWGMNISRGWQRSWFPIFEITGTLAIQLIYLYYIKITDVNKIFAMNIIVNTYLILLQIMLFVKGDTK